MALTQVRAYINGQWRDLTYNPQTARYEAELAAPPRSSIHQPEGHYVLAVEAVSDSGKITTADGTYIKGLRMAVRETDPPVLTLVSPSEGFLTDPQPHILVDITDSDSGVDISSLRVFLDGVDDAAGLSWSEAPGGIRAAYTPSVPFGEGVHSVLFQAADLDGSKAEVLLEYIIDTTAPILWAGTVGAAYVTDAASIVVSGAVSELNLAGLEILVNGESAAVEVEAGGRFAHITSLKVGDNQIQVLATDVAGLTDSVSLRIIRVVTDRTQSDVSRAAQLQSKGWSAMSEAERADWLAGLKGTYNAQDLNRVTACMEYLAEELKKRGYHTGYVPFEAAPGRETWEEKNVPVLNQMEQYLSDVRRMHGIFDEITPVNRNLPETMQKLTYSGANAIERVFADIGAIFPLLDRSGIYSGEIFCGEV